VCWGFGGDFPRVAPLAHWFLVGGTLDQTAIPPDVVAEFLANLDSEFGGDVTGELEVLTTLQRILEDHDLETDVSNSTDLDRYSMRFALECYSRLDDSDPIHVKIASVLPEGIRGRCHYCELLRTVYCRVVKLRASVMQVGKVATGSREASPPQIPSAAAGASPFRKRQLTRSQVLLWGRTEVERYVCVFPSP
jgi:hypothetical protein